MAATGLEFKNVVFNAARDGKLRRLKVSEDSLTDTVKVIVAILDENS